MMIIAQVQVPLLNANEPEARLVGIHIRDRQPVEKGAALFTLETTKAAADVEAPESGFIRLVAAEGDTFAVGDVLAIITETADEPFEAIRPETASPEKVEKHTPAELRITKPARALAEQLGLDLSKLPTGRLVTEAVVREFAAPADQSVALDTGQVGQSILIYGGGGHARTVMEMVMAMGTFDIAGIVDDNIPVGTSVLGISVLGTREILPQLVDRGVRLAANGVGGIIDINVRVRLFELLGSYGFAFPILKHPRATVERSAGVGDGVQVFANAYVGSSAILHPRCMINTNAVVSHDCEIGPYTHVAPGALLAGHVHVGERSLVGMGVTTAIGIKIGNGVRIGNGAILYADVPDRTIVAAGKIWSS
jgi:sugar O-acyltransferase (sialic acid O-acetyltransferase NeuD family)